jgi:hypothetical protein
MWANWFKLLPISPGYWQTCCISIPWSVGMNRALSARINIRDVMKGMELAERIPSGIVHINDQTINLDKRRRAFF